MNEVLNKLSSYNIFNHLFPGAVFCIVAEYIGIMPSPSDLIKQLLWYYFVGMVISRIGSIILEPILKWLSFVPHGEYSAFLRTIEADQKLEIMVEVLNTYRTLAASFLMLLIGVLLAWGGKRLGIPVEWREHLALFGLLFLFLLSYKKQALYVHKRVIHHERGDQ
jgi:hypothetical protein